MIITIKCLWKPDNNLFTFLWTNFLLLLTAKVFKSALLDGFYVFFIMDTLFKAT